MHYLMNRGLLLFELAKLFVFVFLFTILIVYVQRNVSGFWWLLLLGIGISFTVLSFVRVRFVARSDFQERQQVSATRALPDEAVVAVVFDIQSKSRSYSSARAVDQLLNPENMMLITDARVIFAHVNVKPQGLLQLKEDTQVRQLGAEMVRSMSPQEILRSSQKNYALPLAEIESIKLVSLLRNQLEITTHDGKRFSYLIRHKGDLEKARRAFGKLMGERLSCNKRIRFSDFF